MVLNRFVHRIRGRVYGLNLRVWQGGVGQLFCFNPPRVLTRLDPAIFLIYFNFMKPLTPDQLLERLTEMGLPHQIWWHQAVHTVGEAEGVRQSAGFPPGPHSKNLFLKDKKGALYLVTVEDTLRVDLKALQKHLGAARLSFGRAELLLEILGVTPGSVAPFAVINNTDAQLTMVLDKTLAEADMMFAHPLLNTGTVGLSGADLQVFLMACAHPPVIVDFAAL